MRIPFDERYPGGRDRRREVQAERTGAGAEVDDRGATAHLPGRPHGEQFGFRARYEHARAYPQIERTERGASEDVLQRFPVGATSHQGLVFAGLGGVDIGDHQPPAVHPENVGQEHLGVVAGRRYAGFRQARGSADDEDAGPHPVYSASSRA
ncbi:hypothetical protein TPAU25S_01596 [Tsukamurella paurometabola]